MQALSPAEGPGSAAIPAPAEFGGCFPVSPFHSASFLKTRPSSQNRPLCPPGVCGEGGAGCEQGAVLLLPLTSTTQLTQLPRRDAQLPPPPPPPVRHFQPVIRSDSIPNANVNNYKVWKNIALFLLSAFTPHFIQQA